MAKAKVKTEEKASSATKKTAKKAAAKPAVKSNVPQGATVVSKMPSQKELETLKTEDSGYTLAQQDAVEFLASRKQAIYNIARTYRLDPDELHQEGYEVLLTCLRDFTPVFERNDGELISVKFTTFFGNRMDSRAMELRNRDPEYQARQAHTSDMDAEEKERFRSDPPLLVQHLDQETSLQEALRGEASAAQDAATHDVNLKIARDSFFDQKLAELVARETDEKKRAALLQVKVGGVFNFQEMAYHFGVTDSRASQILNDLVDAFYIQRLVDGSIASVAYDFKKLKFNDKRIKRLVDESLKNVSAERAEKVLTVLHESFPKLQFNIPALPKMATHTPQIPVAAMRQHKLPDPTEVCSADELAEYPRIATKDVPLDQLFMLDISFRPPGSVPPGFIAALFDKGQADYPLIIDEKGQIIDGQYRYMYAQESGVKTLTCHIHALPDDTSSKQLRVALNMRQGKADKLEFYCAIYALSELGLSQQKIADALGTSRTNVIVYTKVKDRATTAMQQLFLDGLIQITNASSCVDLTAELQDRIASFIRTYGQEWSRGAPFNELLKAAKGGKLAQLEKKQAAAQPQARAPSPVASSSGSAMAVSSQASSQNMADATGAAQHLAEQLEQYRQALRDAEVWTAQRESIITRQTEELTGLKAETDQLKQELEAAELAKFGDKDSLQQALGEIRAFHDVSSRLASCVHGAKAAGQQLRNLKINQRQQRELLALVDELERMTSALRASALAKAGRRPFTERNS